MLLTLLLIGPRINNSLAICPAAYQNILLDQFSVMMQDKDFVLINVHDPYQGEIPRTDLLIPYNQIEKRESELPADKSTKIVVYGLTGPKGYAAAQKLFELGYTNIIHFNGGMQAWTEAGHHLLYRGQ
jgi:rhodanese-related sulfurtransferase